jgi:PPK2 family polyphosphate:nucleotide phosphotransferase
MDIERLQVVPGSKFKIGKWKADDTNGISKGHTEKAGSVHVKKLSALHDLLYAEQKRALLIVLQGMDAAGKDGTIRRVMSGVNPQGCTVTSFKQPGAIELSHDFLWRIHTAVPPRGAIGIFNRSHYEDVLIARVHQLVPPDVWERRYDEINHFEKILTESGVHIVKFFLHISDGEQKKRFEARMEDPSKNWKISPSDFKEREYWNQYQDAYQDAIAKCSTKYAPWYVIPSDHKWFRNFAVGEILIQTLESFKMHYPKVDAQKLEQLRGEKS